MVVIHSDDGRVEDYAYFRRIVDTAYKNNQWYPFKGNAFCPTINPGYIVQQKYIGHSRQNRRLMTMENLHDIVNNNGEILSHGRYHVYMDWIDDIAEPLKVGDTVISFTSDRWRRFVQGYKYTIEDDSTVEEFTVKTVYENSSIEIESSLQNSFTTDAKIHITEESGMDNLQGAVDDLESIGITCKHHVCAWYDYSERARPWLESVFDSVVTQESTEVPQPINEIDIYDIKRTRDFQHFTSSSMDNMLDATRDMKTVLFVQGHGWPGEYRLKILEELVVKIFEKGLQIVNHSEAVDYIKSKQTELQQ